MQIHREKFLALTATLAGFWPNTACTINIDGLSVSATLDVTTTTAATTSTSTTGGTDDVTSEGGSDGTQGGTGTTAPTTTSPTTTSPTTGGTGTTGGGTTGGASDCCTPHGTPGCDDATIQQCVCDEDAYCCGEERGTWDDTCVAEVNQFGCGVCEIDTGGDTTSEDGSSG